MEHFIVYKDENSYSAFPDIEKLPNGEIIVTFREAVRREIATHIDSTSRAVAIRSKDNGKTWEGKIIVYDDEDGIQDPSIKALSDGSLICNFFKWKVIKQEPFNHQILGTFIVRSYDSGYTWEKELTKVEVPDFKLSGTSDAILELNDGTLLIPMYGAKIGERHRAFILKSKDKGSTWTDFRTVAFDPLGNMDFQEPALTMLPSGKIICMMRVYGVEQYLWQSESLDGGNTWSIPKKTEIWGFPAHLLVLKDGRILCSYGYRRPPYGIRACISYDEGKTWDLKNEIIIRSDGLHEDLGYPSSIELNTGEILTVYYFHDSEETEFIASSIYKI